MLKNKRIGFDLGKYTSIEEVSPYDLPLGVAILITQENNTCIEMDFQYIIKPKEKLNEQKSNGLMASVGSLTNRLYSLKFESCSIKDFQDSFEIFLASIKHIVVNTKSGNLVIQALRNYKTEIFL